MARAAQVFRPGSLVYERLNGFGPVVGGNTGGAAMPEEVDRHGKSRFVEGRIIVNHQFEPQFVATFLYQGHADKSAPVFAHKIDDFGGYIPGGGDEIAFIFTVFVVNGDDHPTLFYVFYRAFNGIEHVGILYKGNN